MRTKATALGLLTLLTAACTSPAGSLTEVSCEQTALPACTDGPDRFSDEACASLDDALVRGALRTDAMKAPIVEAPPEGAVLAAATPYTFRLRNQLARLDYAPRTPPALRAMTAWDELSRWTKLVPEAHAHCLPFTGVGYALIFRSGGRVIARAEHSTDNWTPGPVAWSTLVDAGGPIELTVLAARFRESTVEDGPYTPAAPVRFTIR